MNKRSPTKQKRIELFNIQDCRCGICEDLIVGNVFEIDHLVPYACGGPTIDNNLICMCPNCHAIKTKFVDKNIKQLKQQSMECKSNAISRKKLINHIKNMVQFIKNNQICDNNNDSIYCDDYNDYNDDIDNDEIYYNRIYSYLDERDIDTILEFLVENDILDNEESKLHINDLYRDFEHWFDCNRDISSYFITKLSLISFFRKKFNHVQFITPIPLPSC